MFSVVLSVPTSLRPPHRTQPLNRISFDVDIFRSIQSIFTFYNYGFLSLRKNSRPIRVVLPRSNYISLPIHRYAALLSYSVIHLSSIFYSTMALSSLLFSMLMLFFPNPNVKTCILPSSPHFFEAVIISFHADPLLPFAYTDCFPPPCQRPS